MRLYWAGCDARPSEVAGVNPQAHAWKVVRAVSQSLSSGLSPSSQGSQQMPKVGNEIAETLASHL